jgi:Mrp family chromosome partitioning ATPase
MSKIFDALEHAQAERVGPAVQAAQMPASVAPTAVRRAVPVTAIPLDMEEEMTCLYQQIGVLLPGASRLVQFIGSKQGEGTSTIVGAFARVAARHFGQRVLLLEMEPRASSGRSGGSGADATPGAVVPSRVGQTSLYVASLPREIVAASRWLDHTPATMGLWKQLRESFDLIVVDAQPVVLSPESLTIAGQVDGVVLVLEAENTSTRLAALTKDRVERSGGRMLGMVFNKRRQHVPDFLEQRLA